MTALLYAVVTILGFFLTSRANAAIVSCPPATLEQAKQIETPLLDFGINIYKQWSSKTPDKNLIFSPLSVTLALALLENGASGETREEIQTVLAGSGSNVDVLSSYGSLQRELQTSEPGAKLNIANGMFPDKNVPLKEEFMNTLKNCFQSETETMDYKGKLEESRQKINKWVSEKTMEKIPQLFKPGVLTTDVVLVLANAIYFKSDWKNAFNVNSTRPGTFFRHALGQENQTVSFMRRIGNYRYAETNYVQVLEAPYQNTNFSMYVVLPKAKDGLSALESNLTSEMLKSLIEQVKLKRVRFQLPRFTIRTSILMKPLLEDIGLKKMFSSGAEFSRMSDRKQSVSAVVHEAFIKVNENGTEAAAATGVSTASKSMPPLQIIDFVADHPFLYTVVHKPTGAVLFLGKMNYVEDEEE